MVLRVRVVLRTLPVLAALAVPAAAQAATLTVDDDRGDCPAAAYTAIQPAIDAAQPGDVVAICPGTYVEGPGGTGTNALTITKSLRIRGAGADKVRIEPKPGRIADTALQLRDGTGDILVAQGTPAAPITVDVSGITLDGHGTYVEAGAVFLDAAGSFDRSRVTDIVTSEATAATTPGAYRTAFPGVGIAQVTAATGAPSGAARMLTIDRTRVDRYNRVGVLIDGATGDTPPLTAAGHTAHGELIADQIVGRNRCQNVTADGDCSDPEPATTGTLFGQDGVRVTAGSSVLVNSSTISSNQVNGSGAPAPGSATGNANLSLGAGVRLLGAAASRFTKTNLVANAYGAYNAELDGSTADTAVPVKAEGLWWGLAPTSAANVGPAVSPTTNPTTPENPVNGTSTPDGTGTSSTAVDFYPFRSGSQSDPDTGEWPVLDAPIPVDDAPPTVTLTAPATVTAGTSFTLTADPTDDFAVKSVALSQGPTPLATLTRAPYTLSVSVPAGGPCVTRSYGALATDSGGQTAAASTPVRIVGCTTTGPSGPSGPTGPSSPSGPSGPSGPPSVGPTGPGGTTTTTTTPPSTTEPSTTEPSTTTPPPTASTTDDGTPSPPAATDTGTPPGVPAPGLPSVMLTAPASISSAGATIAATPIAPAGVARVDFLLGNRLLCSVTQPPYVCAVLPTGADVGVQALRVVLTDLAGNTVESTRSVRISRFKPAGLKLGLGHKLRVGRSNRQHRRLSGQIKRPGRVTAADGCDGGHVALKVTLHGRTVLDVQTPLTPTCRFARQVTLPIPKRGTTLRATARFVGTDVLSSATTVRSLH